MHGKSNEVSEKGSSLFYEWEYGRKTHIHQCLQKDHSFINGHKLSKANHLLSKSMKQIEGMENVFSIAEIFRNVKFEDDTASIIPFAKSKADILAIAGLDDKLSDATRVVIWTNNWKLLPHV